MNKGVEPVQIFCRQWGKRNNFSQFCAGVFYKCRMGPNIVSAEIKLQVDIVALKGH